MGKVSRLQLEILASHIVVNLKCDCGCKFGENVNQPCACGWVHVEEWFKDEFDMELKLYPEALEHFYKENYGIDITKEKEK